MNIAEVPANVPTSITVEDADAENESHKSGFTIAKTMTKSGHGDLRQ